VIGTVVGVVDHVDVAFSHRVGLKVFKYEFQRTGHHTKMDGNVLSLRHNLAGGCVDAA
jgi:hypothetical protein